MAAIAIIPARGGSKRIPRKNIRDFHGKPIIAYSIETAFESELFEEVYVSTEDEEIADIAMEYGAYALRRPKDLADGKTGTQAVIQHALTNRLRINGKNFESEFTCCIYATSPLMKADDLKNGRRTLDMPLTDYVVCVGTDPLRDAGQWYWGQTECFCRGYSLWGWGTRLYNLQDARICDINTEEDWQRAEQMYLKLQEEK